jgi:hypothetical protein
VPADVVNHIANGSTVFSSNGRQTLAEYATCGKADFAGNHPPTALLPPEGANLSLADRRLQASGGAARALGVTHLRPRTRAWAGVARNWMCGARADCQLLLDRFRRRRHRVLIAAAVSAGRALWCLLERAMTGRIIETDARVVEGGWIGLPRAAPR